MKKYVDKDGLAYFAQEFYDKTKNGYVTPEMFGAKGDGVEDDVQAIQDAIDSGIPVYMVNKYLIEESLTVSSSTTIRCDGEINYTGTSSAIIITTQFVNLYIKELLTNGNGIELRPTYGQASTACQMDIIECGRIKCNGSNGIGLYLNSADGITQFCKFIINRLQGGNSIGTNIGIKIVGTAQSNKYCNACVFDINSICFFATGILTETVSGSCISNTFNNIHFESNTVAMDMANARFRMNANFDEPSSGTIKILNGTGCYLTVELLAETKLDLTELSNITSAFYEIKGNIQNNNGIHLTDNLYITKLGMFSIGSSTPFVASVLTDVIGSNIVKYVKNGDIISLPSIRKGNSAAGYILPEYKLYFFPSDTSNGSITLNFSDGTSKTINYSSWNNVVTIIPNAGNTGQAALYQAL